MRYLTRVSENALEALQALSGLDARTERLQSVSVALRAGKAVT